MHTGSWLKSSHSEAATNCVECRATDGAVDLRDTQNRDHGHLSFPTAEWTAFVHATRTGQL